MVLSPVRDELDAGNHVVYVDFEDDESSVVGRLLALSVKPVLIDEGFHYIRPEGPLAGRSRDDLDEVLHTFSPTLAICDGVTEAMSLHGLDPNKNADIAVFNGPLIKPLTDAGAAAVSLDHVVKNGDDRGRYALGGVHKLNAVSGAGYILTNRHPFGVGLTGRSTLTDRQGPPGAAAPGLGLPSTGGRYRYETGAVSHAQRRLGRA